MSSSVNNDQKIYSVSKSSTKVLLIIQYYSKEIVIFIYYSVADHESNAGNALRAGIGAGAGGICFIFIFLVVCGVPYHSSKSSRKNPVHTVGRVLAGTHTLNSVSNSTVRTPAEQPASSNLQTVGFQYVAPTLNPQYEAPLPRPPPYFSTTKGSFTEQLPPTYNELFQN